MCANSLIGFHDRSFCEPIVLPSRLLPQTRKMTVVDDTYQRSFVPRAFDSFVDHTRADTDEYDVLVGKKSFGLADRDVDRVTRAVKRRVLTERWRQCLRVVTNLQRRTVRVGGACSDGNFLDGPGIRGNVVHIVVREVDRLV